MSEENAAMHVIAEYDNQADADAAQSALQSEGVTFTLNKGETYTLAVPIAQVVTALQALANLDAAPDEGWEESAEGAIEGWLCLNCDTVVAETEPACRECGTLRSAQPQADDEE